VLADNERNKIDFKVSKIQQFELFRPVSKRKLKNIFRLFYNEKGEPYTAQRNQYLYRQGDPVSGIFCILSGELNRIKENWQL
jgi:CRP-like cAMP-binding protein